jgi:hypothetical protein
MADRGRHRPPKGYSEQSKSRTMSAAMQYVGLCANLLWRVRRRTMPFTKCQFLPWPYLSSSHAPRRDFRPVLKPTATPIRWQRRHAIRRFMSQSALSNAMPHGAIYKMAIFAMAASFEPARAGA